MSKFTETMYRNAQWSLKGLNTGEPHAPIRQTWAEVHQRARQVAGGLAAAGIGHGDAVAVLAGAPVEIAPTAQGAWMRGASVTMLHQPTPRTDLVRWAEETTAVIDMIAAKAVVVSDPFMAAAPVLEGIGITVLTIENLLQSAPIDPIDTDDDDVALMQLTSGSTGSPKAVLITPRQHRGQRRGDDRRLRLRHRHRCDRQLAALLPRHGHDRLPDRADVLRRRAGEGHADRLPARHAAVGQAHRQVQGHHDGRPELRLQPVRQAAAHQAKPGDFDLSSLRWALSGAEQVDPADVEDLCDAGAPFGLRREAIIPAYGMAETTVAVSFSECGGGMVVDEVDADLLSVLHRAVPSTKGHTRRLVSLGKPLKGLEVRVVDEDGRRCAPRAVGVIEARGTPVTRGYMTVGGFIAAQDERGWYDTGDLGYLTETGEVVVCGRIKDVIIMAGRNIYPTDIERAAARVDGVRPGCAVAVRLEAGRSRETFAVAVESKTHDDPDEVRRIERQVAHEVVAEVNARPRNVVVLEPGTIPKTPSGKLRRAHALTLVT